jgi:hypothetical protein
MLDIKASEISRPLMQIVSLVLLLFVGSGVSAQTKSFSEFITGIDSRVVQTKRSSDKPPYRYFRVADSVLTNCLSSKEFITPNPIDTFVIHYSISNEGVIELERIVTSKRERITSAVVEECIGSIPRFNREGETKNGSGSYYRYVAVYYFIVEENLVR